MENLVASLQEVFVYWSNLFEFLKYRLYSTYVYFCVASFVFALCIYKVWYHYFRMAILTSFMIRSSTSESVATNRLTFLFCFCLFKRFLRCQSWANHGLFFSLVFRPNIFLVTFAVTVLMFSHHFSTLFRFTSLALF